MHAGLMLCGSKSFKKMIKLQSGIRATLYLCLIFFNVIMVTNITLTEICLLINPVFLSAIE